MYQPTFRAWDKKAKCMLFDTQDVMVTNKGVFQLKADVRGTLWEQLPASRFELMSSIGILDETFTPIYEGDIVECTDFLTGKTHVGVIEHSPYASFSLRVQTQRGERWLYRFEDYRTHVTGNVFEHHDQFVRG